MVFNIMNSLFFQMTEMCEVDGTSDHGPLSRK